MTSRDSMYKKPLERYLCGKINEFHPRTVKSIHIRRVAADDDGCNWEIIETMPQMTPKVAIEVDHHVIAPARDAINLKPQRSK
ncbi:MAG TPA: hypothetical protein VM659_03225 [Dongiaceae bacterium]|nr:hypothetical protein [Dongiaceae bacterium]